MAQFRYSAIDGQGLRSGGSIEAPDRERAADMLLARGLTPASLRMERKSRFWRRAELSPEERLTFIRDLGNLLSAGIAIDPALGLVVEQTLRPQAAAALAGLRQRVRSGESLGRALEGLGKLFPADFIGMVMAGEQGGNLASTLRHLTALEENRARFRQRLISSLVYPGLLAAMTVAALILMAAYVIPQFAELFADSAARLPASTLVVLAIGNFLGNYGFALIAMLALSGLLFLRAMQSEPIRARVDLLLLRRTGLIGRLVRDTELARYMRTLAELLRGGVPLVAALAMACSCLRNTALAAAADGVRRRVRNGDGLSRAAAAEPLFPPRLVRLLALAEQTASLPQALLDLAGVMETECGVAMERALVLLPPILTLLLGGIIGFIFASLITGLISLNDLVH